MRAIIMLLVLFASWSGAVAATEKVDRALQKLDESLAKKSVYEREKSLKIERLRSRLHRSDSDFDSYQALIALYSEYESIKYDSAHEYAQKSLRMAQKIGKREYVVEAKCAVVFCLLSAGFYKEALDVFESIDATGTPPTYRKKYFSVGSRLYYDLADFNHTLPYQDSYIKRGSCYADSLLHYLEPQSAEWLYAVAMRQMKEYNYEESAATFKKLLRHTDLSLHTKAIVTSCLSFISLSQDERERALLYSVEAAICDNETATKETVALCELAGMLYEDGDVERATRYVHLALDDANFYGARQRKIQVGDILPIIEQDHYNVVNNERNAITVAFLVALLGMALLLVGIYIIRRQNRKLRQARQIVEQRNGELQQANSQLNEANSIKDEYIGKTFYLNAEYINKVEKLYKALDRKIVTKRYEDLRSTLSESELMAERKSMFADFDETFLRLFPDYVACYNLLFDEKDRKQPVNDKSLTSEMRIYALIRLGITDSERIAAFLDYSVHTINTYKTRIKNKSIVDNDEFESRIMAI